MGFGDRIQHAWNVFLNKDPTSNYDYNIGPILSMRPDRARYTRGNERSILMSVLTKIAIDVASVTIEHARLDENGRYVETVKSGLNNCLTLEANLDQSGREFIQDAVMSMFDEGVVALVPVDTTVNPFTSSYDINELRTGKIVNWYPQHIKVRVYNELSGRYEERILPKRMVAIVENPLYAVMNEPNSTFQRLIRKLNLLDIVDEQSGSGKLDMIIQLPYTIRSDAQREQANRRRKEIEMQLSGSKFGIAYADATEKITQLNRSLDNNLLKQIEYLTEMFYNQLGITKAVFDGTADEKEMINYYNRTLDPILSALCDSMKRKFLTKTARTKMQSIYYYRNPFKLVPSSELAELADKFTRNEIVSSNEFRQIIGLRPSDDPRADMLLNKNMPTEEYDPDADMQELDEFDQQLADMEQEYGGQ